MTLPTKSVAERLRERVAARLAQGELTLPPPPPPTPTPTPSTPTIASNTWSPSPIPEVGPVMPLSMVTYVQSAFWDNSDKPETYVCSNTGKTRKRKGPFHKLSIDLWTAPTDQIVKAYSGKAFIRNIQLRKPAQFEVNVLDVNLKSRKITQSFYDEVRAILMTCDLNNDFFGVIIDRDTWTYHQHQFVHVRWTDGKPVVDLYVNGEVMTIDTYQNEELSEAQHEKGIRFTAKYYTNV